MKKTPDLKLIDCTKLKIGEGAYIGGIGFKPPVPKTEQKYYVSILKIYYPEQAFAAGTAPDEVLKQWFAEQSGRLMSDLNKMAQRCNVDCHAEFQVETHVIDYNPKK